MNQPTKDEINEALGTSNADWDNKKWKTIDTSASGDSWKPEKGESLEGVFTGKTREAVTKYGPKTLYMIEKSNHENVWVWESAQLKRGFSQLEAGQVIKITYKGRVLPDKGNAYNDFEIQLAE